VKVFLDKPVPMYGEEVRISFRVEAIFGGATMEESGARLNDETNVFVYSVGQVEVFEHRVSRKRLVKTRFVQ
jgi:hypothetical protein